MENFKKITVALLLASVISGCGLFTVDETRVVKPEPTIEVVVDKNLATKIADSLKEAPKEDCEKIYTFFSGLSSYLQKTDSNYSTDEVLNRILLNVQQDYGWNRERYPSFTTVISDDIVKLKLDIPHKLNDVNEQGKNYRDILIQTMDGYKLIIKKIIESK